METPQLGTQDLYALGFRFKVSFQFSSSDQNFDMVFQKVSGLGIKRGVETNNGGGKRIGKKDFTNLTLIKGLSITRIDRWHTFRETIFKKKVPQIGAVLVSLLDEKGQPVNSWKLYAVTPIGWTFSDLDATNSAIIMETIELTYMNMQFF